MAEAFGVAAGVFGVVSLSIQLAESVQKVKGFYANVKNAPPRLADLLEEIAEMSELIKELEHEQQSTGVISSPPMNKCIESSLKAVEYFAAFSVELDTRVKTRKFGGGIQFALGQEEIERMLNRVERAKSLLTLAYMQYQTALQRHQHDQMIQTLQGLALDQDTFLQLVKPTLIAQGRLVSDGMMIPNTKASPCGKRMFEARTPAWLSTTIWNLAIERSVSGWKFTIRTYGITASDGPILTACRDGNVYEMQRLFDNRVASPFDQDEHGLSLWDLALLNANINALHCLLTYGVEPSGCMRYSYGHFWHWALKTNYTDEEIREALRAIRQYYDDDQPKSASDEAATHWALSSPDNASFSRFWQTLYRWNGSILCHPTVPRPLAGLLTRYNANYMGDETQLQSLALFFGTLLAAWPYQYGSPNTIADVEELIVVAILTGLDVHVGGSGHSPFQLMLVGFSNAWGDSRSITSSRLLTKALLAWLEVLQRADVDIGIYGKKEERIRKRYRPRHFWPSMYRYGFWSFVGASAVPETYEFQFTYGPTLADWSVTLLDFVEECSGDFWRLVEAQAEEAFFEKCVSPGGWIDG